MRQTFMIQLVGGPDDGAVFETTHLPVKWEMVKARGSIISCLAFFSRQTEQADVYWRTQQLSRGGHLIYRYEGLHCQGVLI